MACIGSGFSGADQLEQVIEIVKTSGALDYCMQRAKQETDAALQSLQALPQSVYRDALANLAKLALDRIQ